MKFTGDRLRRWEKAKQGQGCLGWGEISGTGQKVQRIYTYFFDTGGYGMVNSSQQL